ncbi:MAG: polysaccharide pyruvyl transferase family protein, partial [Bifidobacteriaceae bacterium]|nr:polysaccharide pyruvyl transferase family protein [Bifidobacteriaceae bacterium]
MPESVTAAIINFHFAHNFGAVLQAVALRHQLESLGCSTQVIDYRPRAHAQVYAPLPNPIISAIWRYRGAAAVGAPPTTAVHLAARHAARALSEWPQVNRRRRRLRQFRAYAREHLNLTQSYRSLASLRRDPPDADIYIAGSDQIWNPGVTGGLDPAYFLCFGAENVIRAAYAVSCPSLDVGRFRDDLRRLSCRLAPISLREKHSRLELSAALGREITVCPDPTLFVEADEWLRFSDPVQPVS